MFQFFLLLSLFGLSLADQQSVAVIGNLVCNGKPQKDIRVKLYDIDTFTIDDKLGEVKTDSNGAFRLSGAGKEDTKMKTKFNIYHRCGMGIKLCYYKNSFEIPDSYVTTSGGGKVYNAGKIELSSLPKNRDCLN